MGVRGTLTRALRGRLGRDSSVELALRSTQNRMRLMRGGVVTATDTYVATGNDEHRLGIYGYGGCDVWAIATAGRRLSRMTDATIAINAFGRARFTRSDLILQTLTEVDRTATAEVERRLQLEPAMFEPLLFEPDFTVPAVPSAGTFPKSVVVLSISSDLVRVLYRHRRHDFLVDPGGFWLASGIEAALGDLEEVKWFNENFVTARRITLEASMRNFRKLIPLVREQTGAEVVVFNCLTVDPSRYSLDYDHSHSPHRTRRRDFAGALVDLAREYDFSIVDVDRAIKGVGMDGMVDFVKFGPIQRRAIAEAFVEVLRDRKLV